MNESTTANGQPKNLQFRNIRNLLRKKLRLRKKKRKRRRILPIIRRSEVINFQH